MTAIFRFRLILNWRIIILWLAKVFIVWLLLRIEIRIKRIIIPIVIFFFQINISYAPSYSHVIIINIIIPKIIIITVSDTALTLKCYWRILFARQLLLLIIGILFFSYYFLTISNSVLQGFVNIYKFCLAPFNFFFWLFVLLIAIH